MSYVATGLIIATSINLIVTLTTLLLTKIGNKHKNFKEVCTIALGGLKSRKTYAILLSVLTIFLFLHRNPEITIGIAICTANLVTIVLSAVSSKLLKFKLREKMLYDSIAVINLGPSNGDSLEIWFKKSQEEWPPVNLEIGMGPWVINTESLDTNLTESIRSIITQSQILKTPDIQTELKNILNNNGVTHPMDIKGGDIIPELKSFFEEILLFTKVVNKENNDKTIPEVEILDTKLRTST
jgi:hypothetical protein